MPVEAPSPDEISLALGETSDLDEPSPDPYADEDGEFMAAARAAVGDETKATALKDAIEACLRKHGLLTSAVEEEAEDDDSEVGSGFPDF
jgi:hypothetical protein